MAPDPRRVVGGTVWAKAEHVSRDSKRIYGSLASKTWLKGLVLKVTSVRPEGKARATTVVQAQYSVGDVEKIKDLSLQVLKATNPNEATAVPNSDTTNNNETSTETPPATGVNASPTTAAGETNEGLAEGARATAGSTPEQGSTVTDESTPNSTSTTNSGPTPVSTNHGRQWFEGPTDVDVNGPVPMKFWRMVDQYTGREFTPGCDDVPTKNQKFTPYDFFMACFPRDQLKAMLELTNASLKIAKKKLTSYGELLKWMGINILITRFEFGCRSSLWNTTPPSKYIPAPAFGAKTGMSRDRYNDLLSHIAWSFQPSVRPPEMSSEEHRWTLCQDFIDRFNEHRKAFMSPGFLICVDESISRWYGLGGHWINVGLPQYVSMDRKPDDGCEIQNSACGQSGIMLRLKLVKSAACIAETEKENADQVLEGVVEDSNGYVCCHCY